MKEYIVESGGSLYNENTGKVEFNLIVNGELVRCRDCKYWHREIYNGVEYFNFSSCDLNHHGDGNTFYCANAERKES